MSVFDDLHQVHAVLGLDGDKSEVIDDQQIPAPDVVKELRCLSLGPCDLATHKQLLHVEVPHAPSEQHRSCSTVLTHNMYLLGCIRWFLLIPIYNLILACTDGVNGGNEYGADPKANVFERFGAHRSS